MRIETFVIFTTLQLVWCMEITPTSNQTLPKLTNAWFSSVIQGILGKLTNSSGDNSLLKPSSTTAGTNESVSSLRNTAIETLVEEIPSTAPTTRTVKPTVSIPQNVLATTQTSLTFTSSENEINTEPLSRIFDNIFAKLLNKDTSKTVATAKPRTKFNTSAATSGEKKLIAQSIVTTKVSATSGNISPDASYETTTTVESIVAKTTATVTTTSTNTTPKSTRTPVPPDPQTAGALVDGSMSRNIIVSDLVDISRNSTTRPVYLNLPNSSPATVDQPSGLTPLTLTSSKRYIRPSTLHTNITIVTTPLATTEKSTLSPFVLNLIAQGLLRQRQQPAEASDNVDLGSGNISRTTTSARETDTLSARTDSLTESIIFTTIQPSTETTDIMKVKSTATRKETEVGPITTATLGSRTTDKIFTPLTIQNLTNIVATDITTTSAVWTTNTPTVKTAMVTTPSKGPPIVSKSPAHTTTNLDTVTNPSMISSLWIRSSTTPSTTQSSGAVDLGLNPVSVPSQPITFRLPRMRRPILLENTEDTPPKVTRTDTTLPISTVTESSVEATSSSIRHLPKGVLTTLMTLPAVICILTAV